MRSVRGFADVPVGDYRESHLARNGHLVVAGAPIKRLIFAVAVTNVTLDVGCMGTIPATQTITFLNVLDNKQNTCHNVTC